MDEDKDSVLKACFGADSTMVIDEGYLQVKHTCMHPEWAKIKFNIEITLSVVDDWAQGRNLDAQEWARLAGQLNELLAMVQDGKIDKEAMLRKILPPNGMTETIYRKKVINPINWLGRRYPKVNSSVHESTFVLARNFLTWLCGDCESLGFMPKAADSSWRLNSIKDKKTKIETLPRIDNPGALDILERVGQNLRYPNGQFDKDKIKTLRYWFDSHQYWFHYLRHDESYPKPGSHKPGVSASALESVLMVDRILTVIFRKFSFINCQYLQQHLQPNLIEIEAALNAAQTYTEFRDAFESLSITEPMERIRLQLGLVWLLVQNYRCIEKEKSIYQLTQDVFDLGARRLQLAFVDDSSAYHRTKDFERINNSAQALYNFICILTDTVSKTPDIVIDCLFPLEIIEQIPIGSENVIPYLPEETIRSLYEKKIANRSRNGLKCYFENKFGDLVAKKTKISRSEVEEDKTSAAVSSSANIKSFKERLLPFVFTFSRVSGRLKKNGSNNINKAKETLTQAYPGLLVVAPDEYNNPSDILDEPPEAFLNSVDTDGNVFHLNSEDINAVLVIADTFYEREHDRWKKKKDIDSDIVEYLVKLYVRTNNDGFALALRNQPSEKAKAEYIHKKLSNDIEKKQFDRLNENQLPDYAEGMWVWLEGLDKFPAERELAREFVDCLIGILKQAKTFLSTSESE